MVHSVRTDGHQNEWIAVQADTTWLIGRITNKSFDGRKGVYVIDLYREAHFDHILNCSYVNNKDTHTIVRPLDSLIMFQLNITFSTAQGTPYWIIHSPLWFTGCDNDTFNECISIVVNWPLSTRAELFAIVLALLVCPRDCRVKIYTDSNCSILIITRFLCSRSKFRSHGFNNSLILIYIDILIKDRNLDLELIKVKAHVGDPWNELADELAKKGTELPTHHQLTFNFGSQDHRFSPHFEDTLIEQKLRNFLNTMGQVQVCSEWRDLRVNEKVFVQRL
ncbi:hypothetical protein RclHR1_08000006 [Rhizophagus clarus]|uniref:RNase H type-1 domain-containing protein n=1 Tax=Rhizophagus clarus TaxID=94130 RepID=A0A2Z6SMQ9_9GLOM|nr:hypothetical protein RclHR1_08000006 [Rhizophagus clarus]